VAASKLVNFKGDLFATTFSFAMQGGIRLVSSLVLTRVLLPEAYGIITVLVSVLYVIGNIADTNVTLFIVRDKNGEDPRYLNTAWTLRFVRAVLSAIFLLVSARVIAVNIYNVPTLTAPLRVFSLWFLIAGLESMSFPLAIRRKQARLQVYSELGASVISTSFSIAYCYHFHTFWGMALAMLLNMLIMTVLSHQFYRDMRPRFQIDWAAAREILSYSKFTIPSSMLTLALNQFDKVVFLRLFDLRLLGLYGLASNIAGSVETLISKISQTVLYPRCAHNYRSDPDTVAYKYYTENTKLFAGIIGIPAVVGGAARLLIAVLYDSRYAEAGVVLQALMVRVALLSLASPAEDLLISAGAYHVILTGNVLRVGWTVAGSLAGYYLHGFQGFIYGFSLSGLPPLVYYLWVQRSKGMLMVRYELYKFSFAVGVAGKVRNASRLETKTTPRIVLMTADAHATRDTRLARRSAGSKKTGCSVMDLCSG
jgi:O-antigen/teichoic acid export membrane protein